MIIGIADIGEMSEGRMTHVNIVSWKTNKLRRKSRSSTSAEIQAISDAEDETFFVRVMLASFLGYDVSREQRETSLSYIPCIIVTDSKSLYDAYRSQTGGLGMEEKRSALELLDLKERMVRADNKLLKGNNILKWVNSEANLADSLTKPTAKKPLQSFFETGCNWAITLDPLQRSARKRKEQGLEPLTATTEITDRLETAALQTDKTIHTSSTSTLHSSDQTVLETTDDEDDYEDTYEDINRRHRPSLNKS